MKRKTAMNGLLLFLFVFIGAALIPAGYAQQSSDLGMAGRRPGTATSATKANRETSVQTSAGSAWQAGQAETTNSAKWGAEQQGFAPARSTAWTAGAGSFGVSKQPGGIWSELQNSGTAEARSEAANQPKMPAPLITPGPDLMPPGISRTRAASLGKSRFQLSPGGSAGKSGNSKTTLGAGGPQNPFGSRMQSAGRIGTGSGLGSTRQTVGSGSDLDSSLKDSFVSDGRLDSVTPQDMDSSSH